MNGGAVPILRVPDQEDHETMVVPVLIMSCHVSEKSKIGPLIALTMITAQHGMTAIGRPAAWTVRHANAVNIRERLDTAAI
jgi:hypothetical protein